MVLTCRYLTILCGFWWLIVGWTVLAARSEEELWDRRTVSDSCCVVRSISEREHWRRFFLRWWGRLLRQDRGLKRSGTNAFCVFHRPFWQKTVLPEPASSDASISTSCVAFSPSSSESEMVNLARRTAGFRLLERCRGLGSQKSELWRLARRLCCGLLNIIQYGGQEGKSPDDDDKEEEEGWGCWWMVNLFCSPVSTQFSKLNSYCHMNKHQKNHSVISTPNAIIISKCFKTGRFQKRRTVKL